MILSCSSCLLLQVQRHFADITQILKEISVEGPGPTARRVILRLRAVVHLVVV